MPLDPNVPLVYCASAAEVPAGTVLPPGVGVGPCGGCGARVVVSSSTRQLHRDGTAQIACPACCAAVHGDRPTLGVMTPQAVRELHSWDGPP